MNSTVKQSNNGYCTTRQENSKTSIRHLNDALVRGGSQWHLHVTMLLGVASCRVVARISLVKLNCQNQVEQNTKAVTSRLRMNSPVESQNSARKDTIRHMKMTKAEN